MLFTLEKVLAAIRNPQKDFQTRFSRIDLEKAFWDRWKMFLFLMQEIFDIANKKFNKLKK
ncbi:hypothetical protein LEP1GSC043_1711 [Leptospira weilii str. Ecochallenge]|uniref:Uncharacterized protein n=1 Tax=Leptospira weilii str. Ecochallenge TaxID=1049986 RepID=N1UAP7_9LEPT|nr:hypothetical protein LEP1GSC051_4057 [Leptospira sp. P2653]EMY15019.1 hypothetical protein LEP1GSC043_1711 [Leptospira weilii str. Ecochallenge]QDK24182.1 hypothetical protein FHG67_16750 [Leptospira weilii]QDK28143.1 hypothetical protein FHG68_16795 [Leptospira weilii]